MWEGHHHPDGGASCFRAERPIFLNDTRGLLAVQACSVKASVPQSARSSRLQLLPCSECSCN